MDCLLERSYHLQTHTLAAVDPHYWVFLAWVGPLNSKCTQLNYEMNCMNKCTEMYSNVLPMVWVHWWVPVLLWIGSEVNVNADHEVIPLFFSKLPINVPNWQFVWFYWSIIHGMVLFLPQNGPVLLGSHLPITAPDTTGSCVFPCMSVQHY